MRQESSLSMRIQRDTLLELRKFSEEAVKRWIPPDGTDSSTRENRNIDESTAFHQVREVGRKHS